MSEQVIKNLIKVYDLLGVSYISRDILSTKVADESKLQLNLVKKPSIIKKENIKEEVKSLKSIPIQNKQQNKINIEADTKPTEKIEDSINLKEIKQDTKVITKESEKKEVTLDYIGNKEVVLKINQDLKDVKTYEELQIYMESFEYCDLKKTANYTVLGDGNINSDVLVIGEAPGKEEDLSGKPFVGRSGMLLMEALKDIGLKRGGDNANFFLTNTIFWRPPGNRNPSEEEISICFPILNKIIELVSPKVILTIGEIPSKALINNDKSISELRKELFVRTFNFTKKEITVKIKALYHPAYLLRMPTQKLSLWRDLISIKKDLNLN